jgi:hypothetical protein
VRVHCSPPRERYLRDIVMGMSPAERYSHHSRCTSICHDDAVANVTAILRDRRYWTDATLDESTRTAK